MAVRMGWDGSTQIWVNEKNKVHSEDDSPAKIFADGTLMWFKDGMLHREDDKPAILDQQRGDMSWWINGKKHRNKGPAFVGKLVTEWWNHGLRHRINGPAVERMDDVTDSSYYLHGVLITDEVLKKYGMTTDDLTNIKMMEDLAIFIDIASHN